jgi:molybdopterin molybdotransferase
MKLADDCFVHDKDRLRHDQALEILRKNMHAIAGIETFLLGNANGRILASDVVAPRNIPAFDNSAVDGYAFAHDDFEPTGGFFPLKSRIAAGDSATAELAGFAAARIFTGAKMPEGADTIAMQEDCELHVKDGGLYVAIPSGLNKGANRRRAGEDVVTDEIVAKSGIKLRPQDLAAIASTGTYEIQVYKPLKIGLLSSGNEILRPGESFEQGKVYDANHFMLSGLLENLNVEINDLGVCPDDADKVHALLKDASTKFDVIISSGGASKGEEDHFVDALRDLGKCHLWQLAVKPGRPMSFGQIDDTLVFTLPGNPVAAFVCFSLYVRPSIKSLSGTEFSEPQRYQIPAGFSIKSKPDRREFLRGYIINEDNIPIAMKFDRDGSGLITGLRESSGLIEIPEETTSVSKGEMINFIPYSELGI